MSISKYRIDVYYMTGNSRRSRSVSDNVKYTTNSEAMRALDKRIRTFQGNGYAIISREPNQAIMFSMKQKIRAYIKVNVLREVIL